MTTFNDKLSIMQSLWSGMYLRWVVDPEPRVVARLRLKEIIDRNKIARLHVGKLRCQLRELIERAERFGLVLHQDVDTGGDDEREKNYGSMSAFGIFKEDLK